jgi:hypothetical protein
MSYQPQPIDTSQVDLPAEILALTEMMAKNAHEVWAQQRLAQGWTYGPQRKDATKQHPCLTPYEQLSEAEKEYDRRAAMETLRAIIALGYTIRKP